MCEEKHQRTWEAPDKTRVMPFSHYRQGETSFEFLGFEFRWGVNRKGQAWLKRRIARKKLRHSLKRVTEWCRQNRHRRLREQVQLLNAKLRGYKQLLRSEWQPRQLGRVLLSRATDTSAV